MGLADVAVLGALLTAAAWPWLAANLSSFLKPRSAALTAKPAAGSPTDEWRQTWASTLIRLINDIEAGACHFEDDKSALRLTKELLWEIVGGDGPTPSKSK